MIAQGERSEALGLATEKQIHLRRSRASSASISVNSQLKRIQHHAHKNNRCIPTHPSRITHHASRFPSPLPPLAHPPKKPTEENRSARIHTTRIAQLVSPSGVVGRINHDVITYQQIGQRARHHRSLQHPATKPRRPRALRHGYRCLPKTNPHAHRHQQKRKNPLENYFAPGNCRHRDTFLAITHRSHNPTVD